MRNQVMSRALNLGVSHFVDVAQAIALTVFFFLSIFLGFFFYLSLAKRLFTTLVQEKTHISLLLFYH